MLDDAGWQPTSPSPPRAGSNPLCTACKGWNCLAFRRNPGILITSDLSEPHRFCYVLVNRLQSHKNAIYTFWHTIWDTKASVSSAKKFEIWRRGAPSSRTCEPQNDAKRCNWRVTDTLKRWTPNFRHLAHGTHRTASPFHAELCAGRVGSKTPRPGTSDFIETGDFHVIAMWFPCDFGDTSVDLVEFGEFQFFRFLSQSPGWIQWTVVPFLEKHVHRSFQCFQQKMQGICVGYLKKCEGCRRTYLKEMQMLNYEKMIKALQDPGKLMENSWTSAAPCCAMPAGGSLATKCATRTSSAAAFQGCP